jgi:hypothetical protein
VRGVAKKLKIYPVNPFSTNLERFSFQERYRLKHSGVYKITSKATGEFYIGSSKSIFRRWQGHLSALAKGQHSNALMQVTYSLADKVDPLDVFEIEVIEVTTDLFERERHWIEVLKPSFNRYKPVKPQTQQRTLEAVARSVGCKDTMDLFAQLCDGRLIVTRSEAE